MFLYFFFHTELRSLIWLAIRTNSAAIVPNLLGSELGTERHEKDAVEHYQGQALYPAFRVSKFKRNKGSDQQELKVSKIRERDELR